MAAPLRRTDFRFQLKAEDQPGRPVQDLSRLELEALQVTIQEALGRTAAAELVDARVQQRPTDFTTEWWLPA
jgi:hypothetical protein